jgi:hypothetical protein
MSTKQTELVDGCIAKAADDEPVFVLRAQDILAPTHVRDWADHAELRGFNPAKVKAARDTANAMERWPKRKYPD